MNEPVIVYTLFALVATGTSALIIGTIGGWFVRQVQDRQQLSLLQERLERRQINATEQHAELSAAQEQLLELDNITRLQHKRDRIIKDLLKKQNKNRKIVAEKQTALEQTTNKHQQTLAELNSVKKELADSSVRLRIQRTAHDGLKKKFAASQQLASEIASQSAATSHQQSDTKIQSPVIKPEVKSLVTEQASQTATATGAKVTVQGKRPDNKHSAPQLKIIDNSSPAAVADKPAKAGKAAISAQHGDDKPTQVAAENVAATAAKPAIAKPAANVSTEPKKATTEAVPVKSEAARSIAAENKVTAAKNTKTSAKAARSKAASRVKDDLKKIKGIGPAIEVALNGVGIERYEQLAGLDAKAVKELDAKLKKFSGRISRDKWVASARQLRKGVKV